MIEITEYLWEELYTLKKLYDHGKADGLLAELKEQPLNSDYIGDITMQAMYEVFAETRDYWNEDNDQEIYVFFDPILDEFHQLCREYEKKLGISPEKNPHRAEMRRAIQSGLQFHDYSYDYWYYDGSQRDGKCKIILKLYPEFCQMCEIAGGLLEVYDAFSSHVRRLKEELAVTDGQKIIELPRAAEKEGKEAA